MFARMLGACLLGVVIAGFATWRADEPKVIKPDTTAGDTFIPLPTTPDDKTVPLGKDQIDSDFSAIAGRTVKVRFITGQGLTQPYIYPVYLSL